MTASVLGAVPDVSGRPEFELGTTSPSRSVKVIWSARRMVPL